MTEIENVLLVPGFADGVENALADQFLRAKQYAGIDISLDSNIWAESLARYCHIYSPVYADDINTDCAINSRIPALLWIYKIKGVSG